MSHNRAWVWIERKVNKDNEFYPSEVSCFCLKTFPQISFHPADPSLCVFFFFPLMRKNGSSQVLSHCSFVLSSYPSPGSSWGKSKVKCKCPTSHNLLSSVQLLNNAGQSVSLAHTCSSVLRTPWSKEALQLCCSWGVKCTVPHISGILLALWSHYLAHLHTEWHPHSPALPRGPSPTLRNITGSHSLPLFVVSSVGNVLPKC